MWWLPWFCVAPKASPNSPGVGRGSGAGVSLAEDAGIVSASTFDWNLSIHRAGVSLALV